MLKKLPWLHTITGAGGGEPHTVLKRVHEYAWSFIYYHIPLKDQILGTRI